MSPGQSSSSQQSAGYLRCDTHENNVPMRRALESFGFHECGRITVANGTERVAYDWIKEPPHDKHLMVVTPSRTQMRPALSHAIPRKHRSTTPQKPYDFNVSVSKPEMLSWELHATFAGLRPIGGITPVREHYIRSERVQCPPMGCTTRSATSDSADTRPGQHSPRHQVRYYAPRHRPEASHNASHRSAVSIRPQ